MDGGRVWEKPDNRHAADINTPTQTPTHLARGRVPAPRAQQQPHYLLPLRAKRLRRAAEGGLVRDGGPPQGHGSLSGWRSVGTDLYWMDGMDDFDLDGWLAG